MNGVPDNLRSWAEIDLGAMRHNLAHVGQLVGSEVSLMAVLKADAYGHGLSKIGLALDSEAIAFIGLANAAEASRLHEKGVKTRLFLLGPTFPGERPEIVEKGFIPCLSNLKEAQHFSQLATEMGKVATVHLAVDTGMGRGGFSAEELESTLPELLELPNLKIQGIGSHLSSADEDEDFTKRQIAKFSEQVERLRAHIEPEFIHLSNSAGLLGYERGICNLVRPGLLLYGISPMANHQHQNGLQPVMRLMSRVTIVRQLGAGATISYGHSFQADKPMRTATIGIGYGDGYPRAVSDAGAYVLINGERCPLLGRVTMDQIVVDVSHLASVEAGDEVELFGPNLLVTQVAEWAGTIPWEIFTGITPRVQRIFLNK